jgi:hypothetical protein
MIGGLATALALAAASGAAQAQAQGPWIVTCDVPAPYAATTDAAAGPQIFRVGPGLFQAWSPTAKAFGNNLCDAYPCVRNPDRLEGAISSKTMSLTIAVDPQTGQASWRAAGASGLSRSNGVCTIKPDAAAKP